MRDGYSRRRVLQTASTLAAGGAVGCLRLSGSDNPTTTAATTEPTPKTGGDSTRNAPFPADTCLGSVTQAVPSPVYGFEFTSGPDPAVGGHSATTSGDVTISDGTATFGPNGGEIRIPDVKHVDDLTISLFARPSVKATDQWDVMVWYSPTDRPWAGWGLEHGKGAVDFFAQGPQEESSQVLTKSNSPLAVDSWSHVVGHKSGNQLSLYVNGTKAATAQFDYEQISYGGADTVDMVLGRHAGSAVGDRHYHGELDSVALWDGGLSESNLDTLLSKSANCR